MHDLLFVICCLLVVVCCYCLLFVIVVCCCQKKKKKWYEGQGEHTREKFEARRSMGKKKHQDEKEARTRRAKAISSKNKKIGVMPIMSKKTTTNNT